MIAWDANPRKREEIDSNSREATTGVGFGRGGPHTCRRFATSAIFVKVNFMVSKPPPGFCPQRQSCFSYYLRPLGAACVRFACCAILLTLCTVCPPALAAQEKQTEAQSTTKAAEAPNVEAPDASQKAADVKEVDDGKKVADETKPGKVIKGAPPAQGGQIAEPAAKTPAMVSVSKASVLVGSFTVFMLAVFVGFEIIAKVPPTLHTPLMSGSNAISGITVVGAMIAAGAAEGWFGTLLGLVAVVLAMINVVGGFVVTHRMLKMFKKR